MIQVCDPPRTRQVRRLSAEEFCRLAQSEVSSVYRPRSEVLRMLTVGEVWGVYSTRGVPGAGASCCPWMPMWQRRLRCAAFWAGTARQADIF